MAIIEKRMFQIDKIIVETSRTKTLELSPVDKKPFVFVSGQWINLSILPTDQSPVPQSRPYSIASSPSNFSSIQITFNIVGTFTNHLNQLKVNDKLMVMGPFGHFKLNPSEIKNAVFIAGGIGVTPLISMARYANDTKLNLPITFFYSNKTFQTTAFYDELSSLSKTNPSMKMIFTLTSTDEIDLDWKGEKGRVNKQLIEKYVSFPTDSTYFVCGPVKMTQEIASLLKNELNIDSEKIKIEGWG